MKPFLLLLMLTTSAAADGVRSTGPLSDADFLRLVTCGAPPGGDCTSPQPRWPDPGHLTIGFGPVPKGYPADRVTRITRALDRAIAAINAAGSAVRLRRTDTGKTPDITLRPTLFRENDAVSDEAGIADGSVIGAGHVFVWWDDAQNLTHSIILVSQDIPPADIDSIVLEEVTQSLGFLFDIENPAYENVSIFAQDSNTVLTLTGQDAAILRLHYPN